MSDRPRSDASSVRVKDPAEASPPTFALCSANTTQPPEPADALSDGLGEAEEAETLGEAGGEALLVDCDGFGLVGFLLGELCVTGELELGCVPGFWF